MIILILFYPTIIPLLGQETWFLYKESFKLIKNPVYTFAKGLIYFGLKPNYKPG